MLRLSRSFERIWSRLRQAFGRAGRFVAAPGFWNGLFAGTDDFLAWGLGEAMTGPPNLRVSETHSSGKRAEKLLPC